MLNFKNSKDPYWLYIDFQCTWLPCWPSTPLSPLSPFAPSTPWSPLRPLNHSIGIYITVWDCLEVKEDLLCLFSGAYLYFGFLLQMFTCFNVKKNFTFYYANVLLGDITTLRMKIWDFKQGISGSLGAVFLWGRVTPFGVDFVTLKNFYMHKKLYNTLKEREKAQKHNRSSLKLNFGSNYNYWMFVCLCLHYISTISPLTPGSPGSPCRKRGQFSTSIKVLKSYNNVVAASRY